jgi:hypothetical protein
MAPLVPVKGLQKHLGKLRHYDRRKRPFDRWNRSHAHGYMTPANGVWRMRH